MADALDSLLISTCLIMARQSGAQDAYGNTPRTQAALVSNWPCRVSRLTGQEFKGDKEFSINTRKIYMRPPPGVTVVPSMWIQVGTALYDVLTVADPSLLGHHLEILVEQVKG